MAPSYYRVWKMEGTKKDEWIGGSVDAAFAVEIACAAFGVMQNFNPRADLVVAVFNNTTGDIVAYVGRGSGDLEPMRPQPV